MGYTSLMRSECLAMPSLTANGEGEMDVCKEEEEKRVEREGGAYHREC